MNYKWFYLIILTSFPMIQLVLSQKNLCNKDVKIDAISFINDRNAWFFTSNGHYWLLKDEFMRNFSMKSLNSGRPMPAPFKKGDAAVYKDSLNACKGSKTAGKVRKEQEVIVVEMTEKGNMIMIFDLRDGSWKAAHPYNEDRSIGQAQVDWTKPIDAMFVYKQTKIFVIQKERYAAIDYKNLCENPDDFSKQEGGFKNYDFETKDTIDAITMVDGNRFYMFQGMDFYEGNIITEDKGRVTTTKEPGNNIVAKFLNFKGECLDFTQKSTEKTEPPPPPPSSAPETQPPAVEPAQSESPATTPEAALAGTTEEPKDSGSLLWIIIAIIIIIIIILIIIFLIVMSTRKKSDTTAGKQESKVSAAGASSAGKGASRMGSSIDGRGSPSTMSVRSTIGGAGGKASSTIGGSSPSRMSVRSHMSTAPTSTMASKPTASSSVDKKSSIAKSSMSKK